MLRGALIGCGFFAQNQLRAWTQSTDAVIVALCDRDEQRLAETSAKFGIANTYTDASKMLAAEDLDFVDIATTVESHIPLVSLAARHGVPIICQKPFTNKAIEAEELVEICAAHKVSLMVHENFRWQRAIRTIAELLEQGSIGRPFWARITFRSAHDVYKAQPYLAEDEQFIIKDLGIHFLDVARFLFGEVANVTARIQRVNPRIRGEDVATIMLVHERDLVTLIDCSYATAQAEEHFPQTLLEIDGDAGTLRLGADYKILLHNKRQTSIIKAQPDLETWGPAPWHAIQESVFHIQEHFVQCLRNGNAPETSGADNLRTLVLVEAAYESARQGGYPVNVNDYTVK